MLKGIDISNHKPDIRLDRVKSSIDFCIMKATGGTHYVDKTCDPFVQECIKLNIPWGFYHFANDGKYSGAITEAKFFIKNCKNYFGHGIPILDWETDKVSVQWVNDFVEYVHAQTGVWCWVYANPYRFNGIDKVNRNCARWIAAYPMVYRPTLDYNPGKVPKTDGTVCAWQYASDGRVPGYKGNLDISHFYGDLKAWNNYVLGDNKKPEPEPEPEHKIYVLENEHIKVTVELK